MTCLCVVRLDFKRFFETRNRFLMELFIRVDQSQSVVGHGAEHWVFADLDGLFESGERFVVKTLSHVGEPKIMAGLGEVRFDFKRLFVTRDRLIEVAGM